MTRDEAIGVLHEINAMADEMKPGPDVVAVLLHDDKDYWVEWRGTGLVWPEPLDSDKKEER